VSVVAESIPHLRRGAIRDFLKIMGWLNNSVDMFNKSTLTYTFPNGSQIEFFSADQPDKLRGGRRDVLFINECNNISFESYQQLSIRCREFIYLDYNPTAAFWVHTELKDEEDSDFLILTYKDNEALEQSIINEFEKAIKKAETSDYWKNWVNVYVYGIIGSLEGVIFNNWKTIDSIPESAELLGYGQDYGFTNDPTTLVALYRWDGKIIWKELIYRKGMSNSALAKEMKGLGIGNYKPVVADSAEPKTIAELKSYGFNIKGAKKGADSIKHGIALLQDYEMLITSDSLNLIKELRHYQWNDKKANTPMDNYNHCFVGDTQILTDKGNVPINSIKVGDKVLTSEGYKPVLSVFDNGVKPVIDVVFNPEDGASISYLCGTPSHEVKVVGGWKELKDVTKGDTIFVGNDSDSASPVREVFSTEITGAGNQRVYDLMVEDCHEYYANGILVHNCIDAMRYLAQDKLSNRNKSTAFTLAEKW
tara:strand:- start:88 stop:1521 length:1434 start_codon:yes stop_codon:yes gene_type:complete